MILYFFDGLKESIRETESESFWLENPESQNHFFNSRNYGLAVFETCRTYHRSQVFGLEEHLSRLFLSAEILKMQKNFSREKILAGMEKVAKKIFAPELGNPPADFWIRIFLTESFFWISAEPLPDFDLQNYENGVEVQDATFVRPFAEAKYPSPAYLFFSKSQRKNVFETLFFDPENNLLEANHSNVFAVFGQKICTPKKNVLPGITRQKVLEIFPNIEQIPISREKLKTASEIFLTATSTEVVPVRKWGDWSGGNFEVSAEIRKKFRAEVFKKV